MCICNCKNDNDNDRTTLDDIEFIDLDWNGKKISLPHSDKLAQKFHILFDIYK